MMWLLVFFQTDVLDFCCFIHTVFIIYFFPSVIEKTKFILLRSKFLYFLYRTLLVSFVLDHKHRWT